MLKQLVPAVALLAVLGTTAQAQTMTVIYDNFAGNYYGNLDNGGATATNLNTLLVADDINPVDGTAGAPVTGFSFVVSNDGPNDVVASVHTSFYDDFAPDLSGDPGTYLGGVDFPPEVYAAGTLNILSFTAPAGTAVFTTPSDQFFWAGVSFSANPGTSPDDLNLLGQAIIDPPDVGGSDDMAFGSQFQGSNTFDNPPGFEFNLDNYGVPTTNFAWQFISPAPEPSEFAGLGIGLLGLGGLALRARKRGANA